MKLIKKNVYKCSTSSWINNNPDICSPLLRMSYIYDINNITITRIVNFKDNIEVSLNDPTGRCFYEIELTPRNTNASTVYFVVTQERIFFSYPEGHVISSTEKLIAVSLCQEHMDMVNMAIDNYQDQEK